MPRKKPAPLVETTWIQESRDFSINVINDTLQHLENDDKITLSRSERKALVALQINWMNKFQPNKRKPESNPRALTPPPPPKKRKKSTPKATSKTKTVKQLDQLDKVENLNIVKDEEIIVNRICIPRLKPHWSTRQFDIKMPAFAVKQDLISSLFDWPLLDMIMDLPQCEGRNLLQNSIDEALKLAD